MKNMKLRRRLVESVTLSAIAIMSLIGGQLPAHAAGGGAAVVVGSGTISPGLTTVPTPQTFTFSTANLAGAPSVAAGVSTNGGAFAGTVNCSFTGNSTLAGGETSAVGEGTGSGGCSSAAGVAGTSGSISCTIILYVRIGAFVDVVLSCTITINGNPANHAIEVAICVFIPTSVNPTTSYQLVCAVAEVATDL
jgi:hypothetical protein